MFFVSLCVSECWRVNQFVGTFGFIQFVLCYYFHFLLLCRHALPFVAQRNRNGLSGG